MRGVRLEHLGSEHHRRTATQLPRDAREPLEERPTRATGARLGRHDQRADLAGEGCRFVDAVTLEPTLDLPDHALIGRGCDEMDVTTEDGLPATHARILREPVRELLVDTRVTRSGVAAPCLVGVPQLAP